jgi:hypothetical protein
MYSTVRPRWEKALADCMAKGEWAAIPGPMVALPSPGRTRLAAGVAKERLSDLQASGVLKRAPSPDSRLDWARKIIAREEAGDRTVELYTLKLAKAALERG